uniref:Uncharacterized protein n=1 Tax=Oncorhynchus kisutch TaxID=8019 RepID=A0A8C7KMG9_ONCKI
FWGYKRFFAIAFPSYGVCKIAWEVMNIANSLEILANSRVESLELNTAEMVAIRTVAMQNRLALDYLLSEQVVACAVTGGCTNIPDQPEEITDLIQKIRTEGAKYHDYNLDDLGLVMWLSSTFGTW